MNNTESILDPNVIPELQNMIDKLSEIERLTNIINKAPIGSEINKGADTQRKWGDQVDPAQPIGLGVIQARHRMILSKLNQIDKLQKEMEYLGFEYNILFGNK